MVSTQGVKGRGHDTQRWVFRVLTLTNCFAVPRSPPTLRREDSQHAIVLWRLGLLFNDGGERGRDWEQCGEGQAREGAKPCTCQKKAYPCQKKVHAKRKSDRKLKKSQIMPNKSRKTSMPKKSHQRLDFNLACKSMPKKSREKPKKRVVRKAGGV